MRRRPGEETLAFNCSMPAFQLKKRQLETEVGPCLVAVVRSIEGAIGLRWVCHDQVDSARLDALLGAELNTTVMAFILRGVRLIGVNANSPMALRKRSGPRLPAHTGHAICARSPERSRYASCPRRWLACSAAKVADAR